MTEPVDPASVLAELHASAVALEQAADELRRLMPLYEGYRTGSDDFHPGYRLRWEQLVEDKADELVQRYEDRDTRPPAQAIVQRRAEKAAREADPVLYGDYHATRARIEALQKWCSLKREAVSARQSWLRTEGLLTGVRR